MTAQRGSSPRTSTLWSSRPNRVLIDDEAIASNTGIVQRLVGDDVLVFAALKANAYGHGTVLAGEATLAGGARGLTVGDLGAALQLREAGIDEPIVVYPGMRWDREALALAGALSLIVTVTHVEEAESIGFEAPAEIAVLLKLDVGHARLGATVEDIGVLAATVGSQRRLHLAGVVSHLYDGPEPSVSGMQWQLDRASAALDVLESVGALPEYRIVASTAPLLCYGELTWDKRFNVVDPGRLLLGLVNATVAARLGTRQAFVSLRSRLTQVKTVSPDPHVWPYPGRASMRIGTFPLGRGDGLAAIDAGNVLVRGASAPIVGRWIEHTTIDLTEIPEAYAGDDVDVLGGQGAQRIELGDALAAHPNLKPPDVLMSVGASVPRLSTRDANPPRESRTAGPPRA